MKKSFTYKVELDEMELDSIFKKVVLRPPVKSPLIGRHPIPKPVQYPRPLMRGEEDDTSQIKWKVQIEVHNEDMFAPEFDDYDDEFKIKIGSIIKKVLPVVLPKIPKIGPIIAPFLSEEDMEPEVIDYDQHELAELVLAELAEEYEIDAGFWKSVKKFVKKVAPVVIKKVVPMIPEVGPIVAPFLSEEDSDEMEVSPEMEDLILWAVADQLIEEGYELDENFWKKVESWIKPRIPQIIRTFVPMIPKVGPKIAPIIEPFFGEEDNLHYIRPTCARMCTAIACPPGTRKNSCTCQCVRV